MARWILLWLVLLLAHPAQAELQSLFPTGPARQVPEVTPASLFSGARTGLFAPVAPRLPRGVGALGPPSRSAGLLDLIASAEAGRAGYDAVQHGAKVAPPAPPTSLTLAQIDAWIGATPGQPHAIGRYQFIPKTLRRLVRLEKLAPETRFTSRVQDRLALVLLQEAGLSAFEAGALPRQNFMQNLAQIWAGLPLPSGRSYYHGKAGNRATISWASFEAGMARLWPSEG